MVSLLEQQCQWVSLYDLVFIVCYDSVKILDIKLNENLLIK